MQSKVTTYNFFSARWIYHPLNIKAVRFLVLHSLCSHFTRAPFLKCCKHKSKMTFGMLNAQTLQWKYMYIYIIKLIVQFNHLSAQSLMTWDFHTKSPEAADKLLAVMLIKITSNFFDDYILLIWLQRFVRLIYWNLCAVVSHLHGNDWQCAHSLPLTGWFEMAHLLIVANHSCNKLILNHIITARNVFCFSRHHHFHGNYLVILYGVFSATHTQICLSRRLTAFGNRSPFHSKSQYPQTKNGAWACDCEYCDHVQVKTHVKNK